MVSDLQTSALIRPTSVIRKTNIIFVRIEIQFLLKFLPIELSDVSGGFLSSRSASGSKSPDDRVRMSDKVHQLLEVFLPF